MNARTCLLCGKPLSRIWVGAGEDFCSREHRNQYRLRRGMDRLQEANKVASLMRKRENLKQIPTMLDSHGDPRAAASPALGQVQRYSLALPVTRWSPPVQLPRTRGWVREYRASVVDSEPREFGLLRHPPHKLIRGKGTRTIVPAGEGYDEKMQVPSKLRLKGRTGNALRVSMGAGFRLPAMKLRGRRMPRQVTDLPKRNRLIESRIEPFKLPGKYTSRKVRFSLPDLLVPDSPIPERRVKLSGSEAIVLVRRPRAGMPLPRRSDESWSPREEVMPRPIRHAGGRAASPGLVEIARQTSNGYSSVARVTLVPLMPQEAATFGYTSSILRTQTEAAGPAILTAASRTTVSTGPSTKGGGGVHLEEHFDSGWKNWSGGLDDWTLDAAGARTGSPAIFVPTLELRDYEVEFLTRIENRSVTMLFRAASLTQYYFACIAVAAGGGYEFRHGSLIGGVRQEAQPVPLGAIGNPNPKTACSIRLRAAGNDFAVWLDGKAIEQWEDNRLPGGAIGFAGAPDDRARIYWIKVSPAGRSAKEHAKR